MYILSTIFFTYYILILLGWNTANSKKVEYTKKGNKITEKSQHKTPSAKIWKSYDDVSCIVKNVVKTGLNSPKKYIALIKILTLYA